MVSGCEWLVVPLRMTASGIRTNGKQTDGSWSYLDADGYAKTGWFEVGGIWYCADKNGTLYVNTVTPDGYHVNGDGAWVS